jgi:hypothetical protein
MFFTRTETETQGKFGCERCSSIGSPSTAHGICILSTPSKRMRAFALAFLDCTGQAEPDGDIDAPIVVMMSPTKHG